MSSIHYREAAHIIHQGKLIAYPTEAVFGLGCDPFNQQAVMRLLRIKKRPIEKGLILIASEFNQLTPFIQPLSKKQWAPALKSWPGPYTWIVPAHPTTPAWLTGQHQGIAVRITAHPIAKQLCEMTQSALVSTSVNRQGQEPATTAEQARYNCPEIDYIISGEVDPHAQPSRITDLLTGKVLRT